MRDRFPCSSDYGDDLDRMITDEDRDPEKLGTYARRFRNRIEADEELKERSGNDLREAMLLELFYEWRTGGQHLNLKFWNLCAGSRDSNGDVPSVGWCGGEFRVRCYDPYYSYGNLRARAAG